jgi:putative ABC transport system substrate-binding protein
MKWKTFTFILGAAGLLFAAGCGGNQTAGEAGGSQPSGQAEEVYEIGISQIVEHPSLDATREGLLAALKDNGLIEGENLIVDYQNAGNDISAAATIAKNFKADEKDLVVGIATPTALALAGEIKDRPVIFTAVTDPADLGITDVEKPGGNMTGVSDTHPEEIQKLMEFIASHFPEVKTVGTVINAGEPNSVISVERAREALEPHGIEVLERNVTNSSEVLQAAESLVGQADAIFIPKDNTVVSALDAVVGVANKEKIPLFTADIDSVQRGAFASFGYQYYDIGYTTGKLAADILLNDKHPGDIPVGYPEQLDLYINEKAAEAQGIEITPAILELIVDEETHIFRE